MSDLFDKTTDTFKSAEAPYKREKHIDYGKDNPTCQTCIFKEICQKDPPMSDSNHCLAACHRASPVSWKFLMREKYGEKVKEEKRDE